MTLVLIHVKVSVDPSVVTLGTLLRTNPSAMVGDDEQATVGDDEQATTGVLKTEIKLTLACIKLLLYYLHIRPT